MDETYPDWLSEGRTVLNLKDLLQHYMKDPVIVAAKMNSYMAQKGIDRKTRGAKLYLLVDKAVTRDHKTRPTCALPGWTIKKPIFIYFYLFI